MYFNRLKPCLLSKEEKPKSTKKKEKLQSTIKDQDDQQTAEGSDESNDDEEEWSEPSRNNCTRCRRQRSIEGERTSQMTDTLDQMDQAAGLQHLSPCSTSSDTPRGSEFDESEELRESLGETEKVGQQTRPRRARRVLHGCMTIG